jgi:hypothetical protein
VQKDADFEAKRVKFTELHAQVTALNKTLSAVASSYKNLASAGADTLAVFASVLDTKTAPPSNAAAFKRADDLVAAGASVEKKLVSRPARPISPPSIRAAYRLELVSQPRLQTTGCSEGGGGGARQGGRRGRLLQLQGEILFPSLPSFPLQVLLLWLALWTHVCLLLSALTRL